MSKEKQPFPGDVIGGYLHDANTNLKEFTRMDPIKKDKVILQCDCLSDHYMQWLVFEDTTYRERWENEMYVNFSGTEIHGFWRRLKMAWRILTQGEFENDGIILNHDLKILKKFLEDK